MAFVLVPTATAPQAGAGRSVQPARLKPAPLAPFVAVLLKGMCGLVFLLATLPVHAQFTDTPSEVDVTNYSAFVIAADEGVAPDASDRSAIKASVTVQFRRSVFNSPATFNYAVAFQLINDADGLAQEFKSPGGPVTEVVDEKVVMINLPVGGTTFRQRTETFSAAL